MLWALNWKAYWEVLSIPNINGRGWHSTGTLGPLGGACALAKWAQLEPSLKRRSSYPSAAVSPAVWGCRPAVMENPFIQAFAARNGLAFDLVTAVGCPLGKTPFNSQTDG